jgi:hypothetical protein
MPTLNYCHDNHLANELLLFEDEKVYLLMKDLLSKEVVLCLNFLVFVFLSYKIFQIPILIFLNFEECKVELPSDLPPNGKMLIV